MAVRLRIRIRRGSRKVETVALLNSGYEAPSPQLLVPISTAEQLDLWPPKPTARIEDYDTAGGPLRVWVYRNAATVKVICEDAESKEVLVDIVVSPLADEPLISDKLAGRLEIAVEDFAEGLWRFRWEPKEKTRKTE